MPVSGLFIIQDRQHTYNVILRSAGLTTVTMDRAISITYSECVFVDLVTQHEMRMRHVIMSPVACPTVQNVSTLSQKWHAFRGENYWT